MNDSPIAVVLRCMRLRLVAEREELRAWNLFRKLAMSDGTVTLDQADLAWSELKKKAERDFAAEVESEGSE